MSKFWGGADSSSDDSSSDDSSVSSSDSSRGGGGAGANKWVMESDSDSSDEERVVKSAKDRAFETFEAHVKSIRNAMRIKDFNKVQSEFEALNKAIAKGIVKVMNKIGISTLHSYRGAQIFEALGLNEKFIDTYFCKTATSTQATVGWVRR